MASAATPQSPLPKAAADSAPSGAGGRTVGDNERQAGQIYRQLGPMRLAATCLFLIGALLLARFGWDLPLSSDAESALYDVRAVTFAEQVAQDPRVAMVVYTDDTIMQTGQRSPVDRTILANALTNLDAMGAEAIGIDILFDSPQDDDAALIEALTNMQTPTHVAYTTVGENEEAIVYEQQRFLEEFLDMVVVGATDPTSIRLETDSDGVARRWPTQPDNLPSLFSRSLAGGDPAFETYRGAIRYRVPSSSEEPVFLKLPIDLFAEPDLAMAFADQVRGRYILIGGDFVDFDQFETPLSRFGDPVTGASRMIGLEVHAHMLAQLLDDVRPPSVPNWGLWLIALLVVAAATASALVQARAVYVGALLFVQLFLLGGAPFVLQASGVDTLGLPAFGWGAGWLIAYASVGAAARVVGSKQRAFAQGALGKYLPKSVAAQILRDPDKLALHGEKREIFCVFTDLEGFTKLSHAIEPEMVALLLNDYLDRLAAVVLEYGGTLDKFVGDAVVAFWGAPISSPDDGERAAKAAWAMYEAGEAFRRSAPEGVPPIGRTRVGMHWGEAIVGNFGGEGRIQYTAFGDSMNTAARLEAANKALDTRVLVSHEAAERSGLDWYRPMGRITLRGRAKPVEIFEPAPDWDAERRTEFARLVGEHDAGDAAAVGKLTAFLEKVGDSDAISNLIKRLQQTGKGESYVLG